jgi:hypothetical protein
MKKETKLVHMHIEKSVHKKLKLYCVENDLKINAFVTKLIEDFIKGVK